MYCTTHLEDASGVTGAYPHRAVPCSRAAGRAAEQTQQPQQLGPGAPPRGHVQGDGYGHHHAARPGGHTHAHAARLARRTFAGGATR
eukprot:1194633-Prorocentrum_minimum.AAC.1